MLNSQAEYNKFYDGLKKYATHKASGLFSDVGLRADAVDEALNMATDELLEDNEGIDKVEAFAHDIIDKSLVSSVITKRVDTASGNYNEKQLLGEHTRIRKILVKGKFPKVTILDLPEGKHRDICLLYWRDGLTQAEIATELKVTTQYIGQVIKKYSS